MATVGETERLRLRHLSGADAAFMLELLTDPDYIRNIADRGVRTVEDAERYILAGPAASYEKFGFGLYLVELKQPLQPIGLCGLLRRDYHPDVEIGYAFLPAGRGQGYVLESATAVLEVARSLEVDRLVAVTTPDNQPSIRVLEKLGFQFEGMVKLPGHTGPSRFFVRNDSTAETPFI
jgi:ribosomal-protein-alanine N-acetyltransferase